jgi:hypothetical protein
MAIYFKLLRSGNVVRARADGAEPFFVGKITQYTDKKSGADYTGVYNVPSTLLPQLIYRAQDFEAAHGYWAHLIAPTARCEGGNFLTLNTYDRARFTFGFGQFAAHVPDGDFVLFFRDLLARPEATDYFPGLELHQGRIFKRVGDALLPLETSTSTAGLLDLLNPSAATLEDEEQIAGAKFIHWTLQHADVQALQVAHMVATFKRLIRNADTKLNLNGRSAEVAVIVCDILHQGRAKYPAMQQALLSKKPVESLLQLGAVAYPHRLKTLRQALKQAGDLYRSRVWDRASSSFK